MTTPGRTLSCSIALLAVALRLSSTASGQEPVAPLRSEPLFEAISTDGSTTVGRIRSLGLNGRLELVDEDDNDHVIEPGNLVKLSRMDRSAVGRRTDSAVLILPGEEQLRGAIDSADEQQILLQSSLVGELKLPLEAALGFTTGPILDPETEAEVISALQDRQRTSDLLLFENGDRREITFSTLTDDEVSYLDNDRAVRLPRESVRAIGFHPGLVRVPEIVGPFLDLILTDGSRLRLLDATAAEGQLSGQSSFGATLRIPFDQIVEFYRLGGNVVYLSDVAVTREITVPYIGPTRPARPDASAMDGRPLTVDGRRYHRGIGTQSRSLLAYELDPADRRFQATVALEDAAGPLGNVVFRVLVDGEERFASPPMTIDTPPLAVDVDVEGARFLILATEFGLGGGVRDFAAWLEARLIRAPAVDSPPVDQP